MSEDDEYLTKILGIIEKELDIKSDEEFCDILINPQNYNERYEGWLADESKKKHFNTVMTLNAAVSYAFERRGVVTPQELSVFADLRQTSFEEITKGVYAALNHLGIAKKDGDNYKLTEKAWASVKK